MFTHDRPGIDLNGAWSFCPDPMQRCRRQKWRRNPPKRDGISPCWDPKGFWEIQVPGTWKTQFEERKWYAGHATYMKEFDAGPVPAGQEAFLVFDGAVYELVQRGQGALPLRVPGRELEQEGDRLHFPPGRHRQAQETFRR